MNVLGFRESSDHGLSFELLVDGELVGRLVGGEKTGIPYWLIADDLPRLETSGRTIVSVCSCGEYGCGSTSCRVVVEGDRILWGDFDGTTSTGVAISFDWYPYRKVVSEIVSRAHGYREPEGC